MGCIKMVLSNICCALKYPGGVYFILEVYSSFSRQIKLFEGFTLYNS